MGRFVLFGGSNYYPSGGVDDILGTFDTLPEAVHFATKCRYSFDTSKYQIPGPTESVVDVEDNYSEAPLPWAHIICLTTPTPMTKLYSHYHVVGRGFVENYYAEGLVMRQNVV